MMSLEVNSPLVRVENWFDLKYKPAIASIGVALHSPEHLAANPELFQKGYSIIITKEDAPETLTEESSISQLAGSFFVGKGEGNALLTAVKGTVGEIVVISLLDHNTQKTSKIGSIVLENTKTFTCVLLEATEKQTVSVKQVIKAENNRALRALLDKSLRTDK